MATLYVLAKILKVIGYAIPILLSIGGIHSFFYSRSPKYYFKFSKILSKWKDTNWTLTVGYNIPRSNQFFGEFEILLKELYGRNNFNRSFNLQNKKLYEFGDFAVTIQYDLDVSQDENVVVELIFNNMNVTVNTATKKLKELRILFNELEKLVPVKDQWYNMNIKFNSLKNPFYGLMIQRLGEEHVTYFECVFPLSLLYNKQNDESEMRTYTLRVFKEYITINEKNFNILEDVAAKCLLLR